MTEIIGITEIIEIIETESLEIIGMLETSLETENGNGIEEEMLETMNVNGEEIIEITVIEIEKEIADVQDLEVANGEAAKNGPIRRSVLPMKIGENSNKLRKLCTMVCTVKRKFMTRDRKTTLNIRKNGGFSGKNATKKSKIKAKMRTIMITNQIGSLIGPRNPMNCTRMRSM